MSEQTAYQALRKGIKQPRDRIERMENLVGFGWPDVNACMSGVELWIEIKAPTEPKRFDTPLFGSNHRLSQAQKNWFHTQRRAGGKAFIYIETDKHRILMPAEFADGLNEMNVGSLLGYSCWFSARKTLPIQWTALRNKLVTHYESK